MDFIKPKLSFWVFIVFLMPPCFLGCSPASKVPDNVLDTPKHHVSSGEKLLQKNYLYHAKRAFDLALRLDPNYSDAHRGLALVYGRERKFKLALESMCSARDTAKTDREKALACVGFMRLYTMQEAPGWLNKVKGRFYDALHYQKEQPEAYYYMGVAYKKANQLYKSRKAFEEVLQINKGFVVESKKEIESLQESNEP